METRLLLTQVDLYPDMSQITIQGLINNAAADTVFYFHSSRPMQAATPYVFDERLHLKGTNSVSGIEYRGDAATYDSLDGHVIDAGTVITKPNSHDHYVFGIGATNDNSTYSYITIENLTFDGCGIAMLDSPVAHLTVMNNLCRNAAHDKQANPTFDAIIRENHELSDSTISDNVFKDNTVETCMLFDANNETYPFAASPFNRNIISGNVFSNCTEGIHAILKGNSGDNVDDQFVNNVATGIAVKFIEIQGANSPETPKSAAKNLHISGNKVSDFAAHTDDTFGLSIQIFGPYVTDLRIQDNEISDIPGVGISPSDGHPGVRVGIEAGGIVDIGTNDASHHGTLVSGNKIYGTVKPISVDGDSDGINVYTRIADNDIVYFTHPGVDSKGVEANNADHIDEVDQDVATRFLPSNIHATSLPTTVAFDAWVTGDASANTFTVGSDGTITRTGTGAVGLVPDTSSVPGLGPGRAIVYGFGGNDTIMADTTANPTVLARYVLAGGYGAGDTTTGSDGTDTLVGGAGTDTLFSGNSADVLELNMTQAAHFPGKPIVVGHPVNVDGSTSSSVQNTFKQVGTTGADTVVFNSGNATFKLQSQTVTSTITEYNINSVQFDGQLGGDSLTVNGGPSSVPAVKFIATQRLSSLTIASGKTLDMDDQDMIVVGGNKATIQNLINTARNNGAWNGSGIYSSAAANNTSHTTTLGVLSGSEYGTSDTFDDITVSGTDILVKYTYYGDTDFNGVVNFDDYVRTDNGYNNHLTGWRNGDFDGNGAVNFDDYVLIDLAFNSQGGALRPGEGGSSAWEEIAQMDHFQNEGYEAYLIDALADLGITVTHEDFLP